MSERLTPREIKTPQPASVPAQERRGKRRVSVSLQLRIRPLEFSDRNFEEVRTTLNASRNALYFFTKLDHYYSGMRLRITSAYGPFAGSGNWEDTGKVVRVSPSGAREDIATGLFLPTAMTFGPDGALYVSNVGFGPPPVGLGQVLRIVITD